MAFELFLVAAFGAMLAWGFGDFLIQRSVRKIGDLEALAFIGLIGFVGLLPFVLPDIYLLFESQNFLLLVGLGVLAFVVAIFNFEALKEGKLSVVDVVLEFELPITIILGFFLFVESPSIFQFLLIIPIFAGIILISMRKNFSFKKHHLLEKGVFYAIIAAIGLGLCNSFTAFSARSISPLLAIWIPWGIIFIVSMIVILKKRDVRKMFVNAGKFKWLILAMGIADTLAWVFYSFSMVEMNIGIVTAITESYPVIGVILGVALNRERITKYQVLGAILTIGASVALAVTLL